jgi:hypothetical protein
LVFDYFNFTVFAGVRSVWGTGGSSKRCPILNGTNQLISKKKLVLKKNMV